MTKNEFRQGDKVATTKCYDISIYGCSTTIPIGEEGEIEDIDGDVLYVYFSGYCVYLTIPISDVEFIPPYDRQEDFLTRLQALLREFNAEIGYSPENAIIAKIDKHAYNPIELYWDMPSKKWAITADNIMDFNKE